MELDAATLSIIVGAVVTGVVGALGGTKVASVAKARRDGAAEGELAGQAAQSVVTKAEAAAMVAEAERLARIEHNTTVIMRSQEEHAKADEKRFEAVDAYAKETRAKVHAIADKQTEHGFAIPRIEADLRETRRQAGLDSQITDLRGRR